MIADHENFEQTLKDNWDVGRDPCLLRDIWRKCRRLKGQLKEINTKWFLKTSNKVEELRKQLNDVETIMLQDNENFELEHEEKILL